MSQEGEELWVETSRGRLRARLTSDRPRSRILSVEDGQVAKMVKGSARVREDPHADRELAVWLTRNLRSWKHLRKQTHPGLLRVGERVVDNHGDEGYLCQALTVYELEDPLHPARASFGDFLRCAIQLSRAVGVMHRAGFVHGDITPSNVCFYNELPVLIDFEMTVRIGQYVSIEAEDSHYREICCTPVCCSPEQVLRERVTPASDVFCLGLTFLSWISERFGVGHAYLGQTIRQSMGMCARAEYPHWDVVEARLKEPNIIDILTRAIALVPHERYVHADHLAEALEALLEALPDEALDQPLDGGLSADFSPPNNLTYCLDPS